MANEEARGRLVDRLSRDRRRWEAMTPAERRADRERAIAICMVAGAGLLDILAEMVAESERRDGQ